MGIFTGELLRQFSTPIILPFSSNTYARVLNQEMKKFMNTFKSKFDSINIKLDDLQDSIKNFSIAAENFSSRLQLIDKNK
jgi:hypothetical protein